MPSGPIYSIDQVFADPQVRHLGIAQNVVGTKPALRLVGQPISMSRTPSRLVARPPKLGEHTDAVLKEFGFSAPPDRRAAQGECGIANKGGGAR